MDLRSTDGQLVGDSCHRGTLSTILQQPSDPLLVTDVTLRCWMYPAGKVDISQQLAIPKFSQSNHTEGKPSVDTGSLCSEA